MSNRNIFFADDVDSRKAENLLEVMEQIDDDCAKRGIHFVKVSEDGAAEQFGVARLPSLVFFKNDLPSLYEGTYLNPKLGNVNPREKVNPPVSSDKLFEFLRLDSQGQRCRWVFKSGWASSNVMGIICPPGCNRVN